MGSFKCSTFNSLIPNIRQSVSTHFVRNVVVQIRLEHQSILRWKRPFLAPPFFSWLEGIHKHCMTKNHKHWYWISIQYIVIRYIYIYFSAPLPKIQLFRWYPHPPPVAGQSPGGHEKFQDVPITRIGTVGVRTVTMVLSIG